MKKIERQVFEYINYCENVRGMSITTMGFKKFVIRKFIEVTRLKDLRGLDNRIFNEWVLNEVKEGVSARSINTYNSVILAMVRYYLESGMAIPLKIRLIRALKEERNERGFYTKEEIERVIQCTDFVTGLMIRIMFETGMRIAEVTRLRLANFNGRQIKFIGKGKKLREVYVTVYTFKLIEQYIDLYGVKDYLWGIYKYGGNGEAPTVNTVRNKLKKAFIAEGFMDFYPHSLRHSFATDLQMRGASVAEIKEMIGHSNIATTERYLHGFDGKMKELFDKYG